MNSKVDPQSQTVKVFVSLRGNGIEEGMFLEATLDAQTVANATEISRSLLLNENQVYVVSNNTLQLKTIEAVYFNQGKVMVKGLANGDSLVVKPIPGAFDGMKVKTAKR